jgi:hypothetical protein
MGWSYIDRMPADVQKFLDQVVTGPAKVVQSAMVGDTYYAAMRSKHGNVFGAVVLTEGRFGWKVMDEFFGPFACECPAEILDQLSPTDNPLALKWRAKCRALVAA